MKTNFLIAMVTSAILAFTQALRCPSCDSDAIKCTAIHKLKCKGGLVADACGCCAVCAKIKGEDCGGPLNIYGQCNCGLECYKSPSEIIFKGRFVAVGLCVPEFSSFQVSKSPKLKSSKFPATTFPPQRVHVQTFPTTGSQTNPTSPRSGKVTTISTALDGGKISPQLLAQNVSPQRPRVETLTHSSPSTSLTTSSNVFELVSLSSALPAIDAGTKSLQRLDLVVSSQRSSTYSSTIVLEASVSSPSSSLTTSAKQAKVVNVASTLKATDAGTISAQLLELIVSSRESFMQTSAHSSTTTRNSKVLKSVRVTSTMATPNPAILATQLSKQIMSSQRPLQQTRAPLTSLTTTSKVFEIVSVVSVLPAIDVGTVSSQPLGLILSSQRPLNSKVLKPANVTGKMATPNATQLIELMIASQQSLEQSRSEGSTFVLKPTIVTPSTSLTTTSKVLKLVSVVSALPGVDVGTVSFQPLGLIVSSQRPLMQTDAHSSTIVLEPIVAFPSTSSTVNSKVLEPVTVTGKMATPNAGVFATQLSEQIIASQQLIEQTRRESSIIVLKPTIVTLSTSLTTTSKVLELVSVVSALPKVDVGTVSLQPLGLIVSSQKPLMQIGAQSSTIVLEPTVVSPSNSLTTNSRIIEPVSVASKMATPIAGTFATQLSKQMIASQQPLELSRSESSTFVLKPTIVTPSTSLTTTSKVLELVSVVSALPGVDVGTVSLQPLGLIVSSQRPLMQTDAHSSTIVLEPIVAFPSTSSTVNSKVLEPVTVTGKMATPNAGTFATQVSEQMIASQQPIEQTHRASSTIVLKSTIVTPSTSLTTTSKVLELVSVVSALPAIDVGTVSSQPFDLIVSSQRPPVQIGAHNSTIVLEPTVASPSTSLTVNSKVLEFASVASKMATPHAGNFAIQFSEKMMASQQPIEQTRTASSIFALKPNIVTPPTSLTTTSKVSELISAVSILPAIDVGTVPLQPLDLIVSSQRPLMQTDAYNSTIVLEATVVSPSTSLTVNSKILEPVNVASKMVTPHAGNFAIQLSEQVMASQQLIEQTRTASSIFVPKPRIVTPTTSLTTTSKVLEIVSVVSALPAIDVKTVFLQPLGLIVSSQMPPVQIGVHNSTIVLKPTVVSPSTSLTVNSKVLEPVSVASKMVTPNAGTFATQLSEQIMSSQQPLELIHTQTVSFVFESSIDSPDISLTTNSELLEPVSVASTSAAGEASAMFPQLLNLIESSQRSRLQTRGYNSTFALEPTVFLSSTRLKTSAKIFEPVSATGKLNATNVGDISPHLLKQIMSSHRQHYQIRSTTIALGQTSVSPSSCPTTSSETSKPVSFAKTLAATNAATIPLQLLEQTMSSQRPHLLTRSTTIALERTKTAYPSTISSTMLKLVSVSSASVKLNQSTKKLHLSSVKTITA